MIQRIMVDFLFHFVQITIMLYVYTVSHVGEVL